MSEGSDMEEPGASSVPRDAEADDFDDGQDFFAEEEAKGELSAEKKADQAAVDGAVKADDMMKKYLKAKFTLSKRDAPHKMIF